MKFLHQSFKKLTETLLIISIYRQLIIARGKKFCNEKADKSCHVFCANLNLNSENDTMHLEAIIKNLIWMDSTCTLKLVNCSYSKDSNKIWDRVVHSTEIENVKIINSTIDLSDAGLFGLPNLKRLTLINTTTTYLSRKIVGSISNLRELRIEENKFLKAVERDFLQGTRLRYITIRGLDLNETETKKFFRNLTGGDFSVPSVRGLDWSFNNIGNFDKNFLKNYPNLNTLILTNASIANVEEGAFNYGKINSLHLTDNKLQRLPEKVFKTIMNTSTRVFLSGNNFICDCQMEWLQILINRFKGDHFGDFQNLRCQLPPNSVFLDVQMCSRTEKQHLRDHIHDDNTTTNFTFSRNSEPKIVCNATGVELSSDSPTWTIEVDNLGIFYKKPRRFNVTNEAPESIEINISKEISLEETFLWLMNFANGTSPVFNCLKILSHNFTVHVTPESDYLACLASMDKFMETRFADCLPFKTKPTYENQTWLKRKSISLSVICVTILFLFASALGALILYLSIRKNPVLIRGSKRVIVVKRHDKAQILIMPRECERLNQSEGHSQALMSYNQPLLTSRSSLNCDSASTASYVSAIQPTQLEILTYKLNRVQELFPECDEFPSPSTPLPVVPRPQHQRLPPNVDLLFEYEWYTITTTTTSQM